VSGVRERLFDSFKLEDNFPEIHLLRRIDRFLDLSDLRQYLPDFCNHTWRPLLESELMIRARFAACCLAIRSDRRPASQKVASRDGPTHDADVERETLTTNQPFRRRRSSLPGERRLPPSGCDSHAPRQADRGRKTGQRCAPRLRRGLNGPWLNGTLRRNRAGHRRIYARLSVCISYAYDKLNTNYFNLEGEGCCPLFVVDRGNENGFIVVVAGVIPGGRLRRVSLVGDARRLAGR
jgi:hypothetical protein